MWAHTALQCCFYTMLAHLLRSPTRPRLVRSLSLLFTLFVPLHVSKQELFVICICQIHSPVTSLPCASTKHRSTCSEVCPHNLLNWRDVTCWGIGLLSEAGYKPVAGPAPPCIEAQACGNVNTFDSIRLTDVVTIASVFICLSEHCKRFAFAP